MTAEQAIRILIVDDQTLVRQGLATLLSIEPDFEIVGEAADGTEAVAAAVRAVHQGSMYLGPTIAPRIVSQLHRSPAKTGAAASQWLTSRELEVLRLIGQGKSNKEIANQLVITEGTVKNHVSKVLTAIGARDRTQAALWAQSNL